MSSDPTRPLRAPEPVPAEPAPREEPKEDGPLAFEPKPVKPDPESKREKKRRKREERRREDARRPLDSWERYRALTDALDEAQELVDLADHKARFALIMMGGLNAVLFVLGTRPELVDGIPASARPYFAAYIAVYGLAALYFVIQAIESLRPRRARPRVPYTEAGIDEFPLGLRFYEDILQRDAEAYRTAWREIRIGQLNAELALQAHGLARINQAKYAALRRLYTGLQIMTVMLALLLMAAGALVWMDEPPPALKAGQPKRGGLNVLGTPQRVEGLRSREPSGVAYHTRLERLFVVGDEGRVEQVATDGTPVAAHAFPGNLEDVAFHPPSDRLILLSEQRAELVAYDPETGRAAPTWKLDTAALLGQPPGDPGQGFEGLAFRAEAGRPGGGVFYLVHQHAPAMMVAVVFDAGGPGGGLGADSVVGRWTLPYGDATAVTWVPSLERLLVIADTRDRLLVMRTDGAMEAEVVLPGLQQEGVSVTAGDLWIADDRGGLLRFPGAEDALRRGLASAAAVAAVSPEGTAH